MNLDQIPELLSTLCSSVYHFSAPQDAAAPYVVWGETGWPALWADNVCAEMAARGTIALYTSSGDDPLRESIPQALWDAGYIRHKGSTSLEPETGLIRDEWTFEVFLNA